MEFLLVKSLVDVGEIANYRNDNLLNDKLIKWQIEEIANWWSDKWMKW